MKVLSKAEITKAQNRAPVAVAVPEWGSECGIFIARLGGFEREQLLKDVKATESDFTTAGIALTATACTEDGERIFLNREELEETILDPDVVLRLGQEALRINKLLKSSLEESQKN